ncbi:dienelactone hydrolase family protein [Pseudanabaena sp. UWO310]|uniref:dienelactone hydrolase family protein n=1 Tax=Pseudanabaena sp. UWO310 TaxID=2480795 RepID=UPI001157A034|nr:dienelactone hydrolase family protein [Pseudanabaena sp. UWO310]TYQ31316.1 dienelactone hydrolase family protein [Pseudanabaena sp. UWO310]
MTTGTINPTQDNPTQDNSKIRTSRVQIANGDLLIDAYLAEPDRVGTFPAVVVVQEIFGVNIHIREVAERLAKEGYVAIAPALFQRTAPNFESNYAPEDIQVGRGLKDRTKADEILGDIQAAIAYLKGLPKVKGEAIGAIGFCFGGHVVYLTATLPEIKATASFYGGGIPSSTLGNSSGEPTINRTAEIKAPIYAFFGEEDQGIPLTDVDKIESALVAAKISHKIFRYAKAGHGFFCDRRGSYHPEAAADAWTHVLELFQENLK